MCKRSSSPNPALIEPDFGERATKRSRMVSPDSAALTLLALRDFSEPVFTKAPSTPAEHEHEHIHTTPGWKRAFSLDEDPSVTDDENDSDKRSVIVRNSQAEKRGPPVEKALRNPGFLYMPKTKTLPQGKPLAAPPMLAAFGCAKGLGPLSTKLL